MVHLTFSPQSADMLNLFLSPAAIKAANNSMMTQNKVPQPDVQCKETFRKSLLKINLFIKRLKFNIFNDTPANGTMTKSKAQNTTEINPKW